MISYKNSRILVIVPLRLRSQRLPEKILKDLGGKSLALRVLERALKTTKRMPDVSVLAAVDDRRTKKHLEEQLKESVEVIMTPKKLRSGSDRCNFVFKLLLKEKRLNAKGLKGVVNLQGDMPFFDPAALQQILASVRSNKDHREKQMWTLAQKWPLGMNAKSLDHVNVVCDRNSRALYFSRFPIPCTRDFNLKKLLLHIGVYAFTPSALHSFCSSQSPMIEKSESLEQLRALYHNIPIQVLQCKARKGYNFAGIDTRADLKKARSDFERKKYVS